LGVYLPLSKHAIGTTEQHCSLGKKEELSSSFFRGGGGKKGKGRRELFVADRPTNQIKGRQLCRGKGGRGGLSSIPGEGKKKETKKEKTHLSQRDEEEKR